MKKKRNLQTIISASIPVDDYWDLLDLLENQGLSVSRLIKTLIYANLHLGTEKQQEEAKEILKRLKGGRK